MNDRYLGKSHLNTGKAGCWRFESEDKDRWHSDGVVATLSLLRILERRIFK